MQSETYDAADAERRVAEPPKRVAAPARTPFERDRARVVHCASSRRLAAKTQVVGPQSDDFVRNRLTHTLEVAQVARDLARALGCHPDIVETAALAHDLGHPPFGHNGERVLQAWMADHGGFEGNAQTLRILTRLEAKSFATGSAGNRADPGEGTDASVGLNLTRATLDACTKYPWLRDDPQGPVKFGCYPEDLPAFTWMRTGAPDASGAGGPRRCLEAQVMDLADDVAYSVHDVEDGVVAGHIDLSALAAAGAEGRAEVWATVREWYLPGVADDALEETLAGLAGIPSWPTTPYDGTRPALAALKNFTSDVIGRFCGSVQQATFAAGPGPFRRYSADLVVPGHTGLEIALLKGVSAHYVMQSDERVSVMSRQRELLGELLEALYADTALLDPMFREDLANAGEETSRRRVVADQVASLTDASALAWHRQVHTHARSGASHG